MLLARCRLVVAVASMLLFVLLAPACASSPYRLAASSAALRIGPTVTRIARPTTCPEDAQPAIVDLHGPEKVPEWGCLLACPAPKEEYVTDVSAVEDGWYLAPTCQFVCDPDQHRISYLGFEKKAYCAPGAVTDPEQLATFARELRFQRSVQGEEERRAEYLARKTAQDAEREADGRRRQYQAHLDLLEEQLHAMETTPVPWSFELVQAHFTFEQELEGIRQGMHLDSALRESLLARVETLLPRREQSERALGVLRPHREMATDRVMRVRACQQHCDAGSTPCRESCASLAPGTCDACRQALVQCQTSCARTTT